MSAEHDLYFSNPNAQNQNSSKYFGFSIFMHAALAVGALFVSVPMLERLNNEPITIEIAENTEMPPIKPVTLEKPKGEDVKPTLGAPAVHSPAPSAPVDATDAEVIAAPVKKSPRAQAKMATLKTKTSGGETKIAKSAPSRAGIPETIEDIAAPELEEGVDVNQVGALGDDEFENEFKNVDHESQAALRAERSALDAEARLIADEKEAALNALQEDNKAQARAMNEALTATRTKNAAALAQVREGERAAAEKAARDEADRQKAAALAAANSRGAGLTGKGLSNTGENEKATAQSGLPDGVRSIDQLKQMPGNPKPSYSPDERFRREQGEVVFYAFVTEAGKLTSFKLVSSTGYRNLDGKTLAALKKWRFYPGQQGWVEIPQVWTLKGDAEEMPTLLRRKQVSQN